MGLRSSLVEGAADCGRANAAPAALSASSQLVSTVIAVALMAVQLLPIVPAVLMEPGAHGIPLPAALMAGTPATVMLILCLQEWLLRPRSRLGLLRALCWNIVVAMTSGACTAAAIYWASHHLAPFVAIIRDVGGLGPPITIGRAFVMGAITSIFQVGLWAVAFVVPSALEDEKTRQLEIRSLQLEATEQRARADLARLRGQLEPHFLLNTLNLLSGLLSFDTDRARALLASLGELLQDALTEQGEYQTLANEVSWLKRYVEILEARHGDMLKVRWEIDPTTSSAVLPRLLLQPLVENAVRHGALRKRGGGTVTVRAERELVDGNEILVCTVLDDGPGIGAPREGAVGLSNVRRRLELNCPGGRFDLTSGDAGTKAVVVIPLRGDLAARSRAEAVR